MEKEFYELPSHSPGQSNMAIGDYFESIKKNRAKLRQFLAAMPKGGDLHNHLTGATYAELYFRIACEKNLYADMITGKLYPANGSGPEGAIRLSFDMPNFHDTRMKLIDKWSIRNYQPYKCALGPDEYFFGEFGLFAAAATDDVLPRLLHELVQRAAEENVQYLELIGISPNVKASKTCYLPQDIYDKARKTIYEYSLNQANSKHADEEKLFQCFFTMFTEYERQYNSNSQMYDVVYEYYLRNKAILKQDTSPINYFSEAKDSLNSPKLTVNFDTRTIKEGEVTIKLQGYVSRNNEDPVAVFAQMYVVHKTMAMAIDCEDNPVVGCNIAGAENSEYSMFYYKAHMEMFNFLRMQYSAFHPRPVKEIHTSLHAGELDPGLIRPEHLTFHITDAVKAGADRIGHGVDIPFERDSSELLKKMKGGAEGSKPVAIEINLTSNEFILGEEGDAHPFSLYKDCGVPILLCTDDAGILRTSLTEEYVKAAYRYELTYEEVKQIARNSILYSFLDEDAKKTQQEKHEQLLMEFEELFTSK